MEFKSDIIDMALMCVDICKGKEQGVCSPENMVLSIFRKAKEGKDKNDMVTNIQKEIEHR